MEQASQFDTERVSDFAVSPARPNVVAVATTDGAIHQYTGFMRDRSWTVPVSNARVCWADDRVLAWGTQKQGWLLQPDGTVGTFETVDNADLAVAGNRLLAGSRGAGLFSYELSEGQPITRERLHHLQSYLDRTLVTSSLGAVAYVDGARIHFQARPDAEWQVIERPCRAIAFSRDGRQVALVQAREDTLQLAVVSVAQDGSLDVTRHVPSVPVLTKTLVSIDWSLDGSSVLLFAADGGIEIRNVHTSQLTHAMHGDGVPRFFATNDCIITGGPTGLHALRWKPNVSRLWI